MRSFYIDYIDQDDSSERDPFPDETQFELEKEVLVGTTVTLNFKFKNLFDNDYDSDYGKIEDINLKIESDDNDLFADNFEEDYDIGSIANDGTKDYEVSFTIGNEAKARDYTLTITLDGEDGKSARHEVEKELTFNIKRKGNDVRFEKANLTTTTDITTCSPRFMMDVKMRNYGTKNQNDAAISIYNSDLNINENIPHIALESYGENDDTWSRTFNFNLIKPKRLLLLLK
ncbi:hypothetical protein HYU21_01880 [Candidatus Woesearchaeota archaeon]|nr:hypothetical protein [Candidatus Woesearchaeota archaeon]